MNKILVIQTAFIGDAILATAVLEKLHQFYPDAELYFLIRKGHEQLFTDHPFIAETWVWNKSEGKYKSLFRLLKKIRREKFDLVVNLHRFASSGFLTAFSGSSKRAGFTKNPLSVFFNIKAEHILGSGFHETGRNQLLIRKFTDEKPAKPKLYPQPENFEKVSGYKTSGSYVCMAPSSVWYTKMWPEERWVELVKTIRDAKIYLLGGPGDKALCDRIISNAENAEAMNLAGELDLLSSAALMKDARMNYVNDSGPLHIASAMNAPVTSIFCSTVPEFGFYPLSTVTRIIQPEQELDCRPCGLHGYKKCPEGHFKCGRGISVQDVLNPVI